MTVTAGTAVFLSIAITIVVDAAYRAARTRVPTFQKAMQEASRPVLLVEAGLIALGYSAWIFSISSTVLGHQYSASAGALVYGIIALPVIFFLNGPDLTPPPLVYCSGAYAVYAGVLEFGVLPAADSLSGIVPGLLPHIPDEAFVGSSALVFFGAAYYCVRFLSTPAHADVDVDWDELLSDDSDTQATTPESTSTSSSTASPSSITPTSMSWQSTSATGHTTNLNQLEYDWNYSSTAFSDIGGYYDVKNELQGQILRPLEAASNGDDRFARFGLEPERGIMFYGPPGTGKTMFARALAGELDVPFVELSPGDLTSRWINASTEKIQLLFDEAQEIGPCVIFIDEGEHLFGAREAADKGGHTEDRKVTSEFLVQLTREDREAIVVSATNRPDDIDAAILRPGRLDSHFEIGLPDDEARHAILKVHLEEVPSSLTGTELAELASKTEGLTGAELEDLVDDAKRTAAQKNAKKIHRAHFASQTELEELMATRQSDEDSEARPVSEETDPSEITTPEPAPDQAKAADSRDDRSLGYQ